MASTHVKVYTREKAFIGHFGDADRLLRVAGVTDMVLWKIKEEPFYELHVREIKKFITNNGAATKEEVASALEQFVGPQEYGTDDESDAVAVGVSFLLKEGYIDSPYE